MCHSAHYQRMSLKEQRVSVRSPSSAQTSGEHHAHVQKSTVVDANMLATCQSGKHQSVRKSTGKMIFHIYALGHLKTVYLHV